MFNQPNQRNSMEQNNSFSNILINIVIPVLILNKGAKIGLTPVLALCIALAFPLIYGAYCLFKEKRVNYISILGLLNILISGILTLLALGGIWFAIKEAIFPLLIGIFVYLSSKSDTPFFKSMFLNPTVFQLDKLNERLDSNEKQIQFKELMMRSTQFLSLSFLLSAALNFFLAIYIFKPLPEELTLEQKQEALNVQLSHMTAYSMFVILIPTIIVVGFIMYNAFKKITLITGLKMDEYIQQDSKAAKT